MNQARAAEPPRRDPLRPAAPQPLPAIVKPGLKDVIRFVNRARINLVSAFDEAVYRVPILRCARSGPMCGSSPSRKR